MPDVLARKSWDCALVIHLSPFREMVFYQALQIIECIAQGQSVGQIGLDGDGAHTVVAVEASRIGDLGDLDQIGQRDQPVAALGTDVEVVEGRGGALGVALAFENDVVLLAGVDVGGDLARPEHGLQRAADHADRDPEVRGPIVVDVDS